MRPSPPERTALRLLGALPRQSRANVLSWYMGRTALSPGLAAEVRADDLAGARVADYSGLSGPFDCVVVGAALGGAAAHLCAVLGAPFLPQPFILGFRGGSRTDEVAPHLRQTRELAAPILEHNTGVHVLGHFDPAHDGWVTRRLTHVRLKLTRLPASYQAFLRSSLAEGGTVLYLDCSATWLQAHLAERLTYQVGGWGGISPEEFIEGSPRLDAYLASIGSQHRGGWAVEGRRIEKRPESEWGTERGLGADLEAFAREAGYRFRRLRLPHPHDFSTLAFRAHRQLYRSAGVEPQGVVVETFAQYDPTTVLQGALLPLWLIFNTEDSLAFLEARRSEFPPEKPVFFSGLVTFSRPPDWVPWEGWARALEGMDWTPVGARPERYPEDMPALWEGPRKLKAWVREHPRPVRMRLAVDELLELAEAL